MSHLKNRIIYIYSAVALMGLAIGLSSEGIFAQKKKDYWADTKLPFTYFTSKHSVDICYESETKFQGCVFAVQAALDETKPRQELWTVELYSALQEKPKSTFEMGGLVFAEARSMEGKKVGEILKIVKAERAQLFSSLSTLYNTTKRDRLDFAALYTSIKTNIIDKGTAEPRITAEMTNLSKAVVEGPYSEILPTEWLKDMSNGGAVFVGIGIEFKPVDKLMVITRPIKGGPAEIAGLKAKDVLVAVDGVPLLGKSSDEIVGMITGELGTNVKIKVRRGLEEMEFTIARGRIKTQTLVAESIDGNAGSYKWIQLRDFMDEEICNKLRAELKAANEDDKKGIILDLRQNPGGLLNMATCVVGLFVPPQANILEQRFLDPRKSTAVEGCDSPEELSKPIITLIDAGSASASEIVAGALQDLNRSLVMGVRSFGKGTVQTVILESIIYKLHSKKTLATYHLPSGRTPQIVGILPSIEIYPVVDPKEEDKYAYRQEDEYLKVVPAMNKPWEETRPVYVSAIKGCMLANGRAKTDFDPKSDELKFADYQLLSAVDALDCTLNK